MSEITSVDEQRCIAALQEGLLAGYEAVDPETGLPTFAFRLHQFISRGDTVYASLEREHERYRTLEGQQYVPGDRARALLPLVFCRECGQEYYSVWATVDAETGRRRFRAREPFERLAGDDDVADYLYVATDGHWPTDPGGVVARLPEDWLEEYHGRLRVKATRRRDLPQPIWLDPLGRDVGEGGDIGLPGQFVRAPFRLCLRCGVEHGARQTSDFGKLATLSSEGRSTATTILSLATIRAMRRDDTLQPEARKLLSFTDNRQDASLQAGHFNDFVEIGLLRAAIYRAASAAGPAGLRHDELPQRVFDALGLPVAAYASDPDVRFAALDDTRRALRAVLAYRLYRDLKRGWRITSPNLEQCGLLEIRYLALDELCAAEDVWADAHPALRAAAPDTRQAVAKVLLDYMRRALAIKVEYLEEVQQEAILRQSNQRLKAPWALDENEQFERSVVLYPRARPRADAPNPRALYLSRWSTFGQYLRRQSTFPDYALKIGMPETEMLIADLLAALKVAGLVQVVDEPTRADAVPGYQVPASALLWTASDGSRAFHDPLRMPGLAADGGRTNPFFVDFYRAVAASLQGLEAHEHTAQVPREARLEREREFRAAELPILYCTPTMELGVDIAELNAVNMRNVPPTPANYAQRSGRAGRQGQPALVFTYCSSFWPHDQYFFRRPEQMVAGAVMPPRLDLANRDLVRAHVQAIWLAETRLDLGRSLVDVLDVQGEQPTLVLQERVRATIAEAGPRQRARDRAGRVLASLAGELEGADWWHPEWLSDVLGQVGHELDQACERWRGLYRAACAQADAQNRIIRDASRSPADKEQARRLRAEAEAQLALLTHDRDLMQSDFYSYRYFASEGFLPGYSFPRLPLAAYIPGRRGKERREEFLSRPRFLAISEFGPRAVVYHEGARYVINKVILPVRDGAGQSENGGVVTGEAKLCERCGYLHPLGGTEGADVCERCGALLPAALTQLFRMQNVATRRLDRITSDEEERQRIGYEIGTAVRFAEHGGRPTHRAATVERDGAALATLTYGHAATLWRINFGWRRRTADSRPGFLLDVERGYWARSQQEVVEDPADLGDPLSPRQARVIPYVEDHRNCLLVEPAQPLDECQMASLQAALKVAIQTLYQLEDNELAAEPLPGRDDRRLILLYEAAEGGAGALRRLLDDEGAVARVARQALELCHFDPATGADRRRGPRAREDCEAACYDCLMSYYNQRDHDLLDRQVIRELLLQLADARVVASPTPRTREAHLAHLLSQSTSELERDWLRYLDAHSHRLPSHAQPLLPAGNTRPDFLYADEQAAIYVDGPYHTYPERQARDAAQQEALEDAGYLVLRFGHDADWPALLAKNEWLFGKAREAAPPTLQAPPPADGDSGPDLDLFDPRWHGLVRALAAEPGVGVEPGGDLAGPDGRVIGPYAAEVTRDGRRLRLVDAKASGTPTDGGGLAYLRLAPDRVDEALAAIRRALETRP